MFDWGFEERKSELMSVVCSGKCNVMPKRLGTSDWMGKRRRRNLLLNHPEDFADLIPPEYPTVLGSIPQCKNTSKTPAIN